MCRADLVVVQHHVLTLRQSPFELDPLAWVLARPPLEVVDEGAALVAHSLGSLRSSGIRQDQRLRALPTTIRTLGHDASGSHDEFL